MQKYHHKTKALVLGKKNMHVKSGPRMNQSLVAIRLIRIQILNPDPNLTLLLTNFGQNLTTAKNKTKSLAEA